MSENKLRATLAQNLRVLRATKRLSQQDLSDLSEVERATINAIESARGWPSPEKLTALASALNVKEIDLLKGSDATEANLPNLKEVLADNLKLYRKVNYLSQDKLATKAGVTGGLIRNAETARSWPSADALQKIAQALNIEAYELIKEIQDD